ncbi:MAG: adenine methyltransferase [Gammaproteobacteria bacterium]|nr:adenine methyltransferase [Gammaproteobacteria bacterium]
MKTDIHFSSASAEWETPQALFDAKNADYNFTLDVCATPENAKCARFFTREQNGLIQPWAPERCWMNPPYGREIGWWLKKAANEAGYGAFVMCLVPARTDTAWWHDYVMFYSANIEYIRGRLKFGGHKNSAPFPSALVTFGI